MENDSTECSDVEETVGEEITDDNQSAAVRDRKAGRKRKPRKKDDKSIENVLKSIGTLETQEEKLTAMRVKYTKLLDENRKLQFALKQAEKKVIMIQREKEQFQAERSKAVLTRSRLESLCRELQRQNKAVKEESLLKIREEEEKRKEVSVKFQSTLAEITALMTETNEKNVKLHEDNLEIHKKFKSVFDEMDIREQHFEGMHQMMKHELDVTEAMLAKVKLEMTEEKETLLNDKKQLLFKLSEYQTRLRDLQATEVNLRSQISMYTDKYDEFQNALTKSNEAFGGFNEEMEKRSKKIIKLEKEIILWKQRWEKSHATLLEMAADKQMRDNDIMSLNRKCSLLQELCKAFQHERATLLAQLKEKNIVPAQTEATSKLPENSQVQPLEEEKPNSEVESAITNTSSIVENSDNDASKTEIKESISESEESVAISESLIPNAETATEEVTISSENEARLQNSIEDSEVNQNATEVSCESTKELSDSHDNVEVHPLTETETNVSENSLDVNETQVKEIETLIVESNNTVLVADTEKTKKDLPIEICELPLQEPTIVDPPISLHETVLLEKTVQIEPVLYNGVETRQNSTVSNRKIKEGRRRKK